MMSCRGFFSPKNQVKQQVPDAGAHIHGQDILRQLVVAMEMLDDGRAEAVITPEGVAAAEDDDGFVKHLGGHFSTLECLGWRQQVIGNNLFRVAVAGLHLYSGTRSSTPVQSAGTPCTM